VGFEAGIKCGGAESRCSMAIPLRHADPVRATAGARTFFVTSSISDKRNLLQSERSAGLFVRVLYDYRAQRKFRLHEFVVMPDHFHTLLTVECEMTIERAVQFIKGGFAFRAGRELGFRAPIWQKGFSEVRILDAGIPANGEIHSEQSGGTASRCRGGEISVLFGPPGIRT
jgi:putative transposase